MNILFRRRRLGNGSCNGIADQSSTGLAVLRNDAAFPSELTYVFRWGCTSTIPNRDGVTIVNKASAIHWCSNKKQGRLDMQAAGVAVPETWTAEAFANDPRRGVGPPGTDGYFVLRRETHAQGRDLWHGTDTEILQAITRHSVENGYVSRMINKVAEYRVAVVQGRVAWVASKTPADASAIAWNVAQGGSFSNVRWGDWPMAVVKEALKAAIVSETDFCGVDVMVDANGLAYVLEVNSAPSLTSEYRQRCFAKCFDYIVENGKDHFEPVHERPMSWRTTIHPALQAE